MIKSEDESSSGSSYERERVDQEHLPRLSREFYRGHAFVHWTLNIEDRAKGWLTPAFHQEWRSVLLHCCARYDIAVPAYVLMPDHAHLLGMGLTLQTDQRIAIEFLRRYLRPALGQVSWQHQSHDHVLREHQKERGAFTAAARYILENPLREGLVTDLANYPYLGCCVAGYPVLDVLGTDYWEKFWRIYYRKVNST